MSHESSRVSTTLSVFSLMVSILAVGISVRACYTTDAAYVISYRDSDANRKILLEAITASAEIPMVAPTHVTLRPTLEQWKLKKVQIWFPGAFGHGHESLERPFRLRVDMGTSWIESIVRRAREHVPESREQRPGLFQVRLPVVIQAEYTYLGEPNELESRYEIALDVPFTVSGEPGNVAVRDVVLKEHLDDALSGMEDINRRWTRERFVWIELPDTF